MTVIATSIAADDEFFRVTVPVELIGIVSVIVAFSPGVNATLGASGSGDSVSYASSVPAAVTLIALRLTTTESALAGTPSEPVTATSRVVFLNKGAGDASPSPDRVS